VALVGVLAIVIAAMTNGKDGGSYAAGPAASSSVAPLPPQVTDLKDEDAMEVRPSGWTTWTWETEAPRTSCRVTGHLQVLAGGAKDVNVFVATEDDFLNWKNDHDARVYYQSGKKTAVTLDVPVSGAGKYVLVVSNAFSLLTSKTVQTKGLQVTCTE
jgi:hypothetical protein